MNGVPATSVLTALSAMLAPRPTTPQPVAQSQSVATTPSSQQTQQNRLAGADAGQGERPRPPAEPRFEADATLPDDRPLPRGSLLNILA